MTRALRIGKRVSLWVLGPIVCTLAIIATPAPPAGAVDWSTVPAAGGGTTGVVGTYANGCIAGAFALPPEGPGYQVIRLSRKRFFGHPDLVAFIQAFGRKVATAGLGTALVGDMAQPRGGPMPSGHSSHQTGLDVDIWLRLDLPPLPRAQREDLTEVSMVDANARAVDRNRWTDRQADLIRLAAQYPEVERIFVNPAIKHALCRGAKDDRDWLRKVRPWFGHTGHMHVRLGCPADSPGCLPQTPPPPGDGCGDELASWFEPAEPSTSGKREPRPPKVLPAACSAVLSASG